MYTLFVQPSCKYSNLAKRAIVELKAENQFQILDAKADVQITRTPSLRTPQGETISGRDVFTWLMKSVEAHDEEPEPDSRPTMAAADGNDDVQSKFEELKARFA